jgi:hypothetical protein
MYDADLEKKKNSTEHCESYSEEHDAHLEVQMPASLQRLSEAEIATLDSAATKKIDLLLMPILIVLFVRAGIFLF